MECLGIHNVCGINMIVKHNKAQLLYVLFHIIAKANIAMAPKLTGKGKSSRESKNHLAESKKLVKGHAEPNTF